MFKTMLQKVKNKKGFTLMEMLIVVAIIAILVAVAFPVFNAQLESARTATDQANLRSAKAVATATYLTTNAAVATQWFDAAGGTLVTGTKPAAYGQSNAAIAGAAGVPKGKVLEVSVTAAGVFSAEWK